MQTILTKDAVSTRIDQHFGLLEKAGRALELAKRAHRKHERKKEEIETYDSFPTLKARTQRQAEIAQIAHVRLWSYYKKTIAKISHN